ncbi:hypothetical protein [Neobacillus notoginsengisoli]|uniref:hypothetical protein n=1 Tax=Neobacillus notoginsengisoli TaxID=1578198 RepID=UPI001314AD83|nr:hypothetical protein [Neobacillus notoginsengisoli]
MGFGIVPILFFFVIPGVFIVWVSLEVIKLQREKVELLKLIYKRIDEKANH